MKCCKSVKCVHIIQKRVTFSKKCPQCHQSAFPGELGLGKKMLKNGRFWTLLLTSARCCRVRVGKPLLKTIFFKSVRGGTKRVTFSRMGVMGGLARVHTSEHGLRTQIHFSNKMFSNSHYSVWTFVIKFSSKRV